MKLKTLSISLSIAIVAGILSIFTIIEATKVEASGPADPNIVVIMRGPATSVPNPGTTGPASCLQGDLFDAVTDRKIGVGIDCFDAQTPAGDGFFIDRTTYFRFPQGELVARGFTMVQPITFAAGATHLTGDIPIPGTKNIVRGTNRFRGVTGSVRLSGAATLSANALPSFNCIFVIDLD